MSCLLEWTCWWRIGKWERTCSARVAVEDAGGALVGAAEERGCRNARRL